VANRSATYTYDRGGNRTSQTVGGVTTNFTYDSGRRLVSESRSGWSVNHQYDDWGNETDRTTTESSTVTAETFGYNYLNRMSSYVRTVNSSMSAQWQYEFWPSEERAGKTNLGTMASELYTTHGDNVVTDYVRNTSGVISLNNCYAQGLGLDQKSLRIPMSGSRIHILGDMVGTVAMTLTDAGMKSEECVRDIWGNALAGDTSDERYGFAQREHDMESGLVYMRHRMYDPRTGRFMQIDPAHEGSNHYAYVGNRPTSLVDPSGAIIEESGIRGHKQMMKEFNQALLDYSAEFIKLWSNGLRAKVEKVVGASNLKFAKQAVEHAMTLRWLGNTRFSPGGRERQSTTNRFVYTARLAWIDVGHFCNSSFAGFMVGKDLGYSAGLAVEYWQSSVADSQKALGIPLDGNAQSAFTVEDLPSNKAGAGFGQRVAEGTLIIQSVGAHSLLGALPKLMDKSKGEDWIGKRVGKWLATSPALFNIGGAFNQFLTDNEAVDFVDNDSTHRALKRGAHELQTMPSSPTGYRQNRTSNPVFMAPEYHNAVAPNTPAGSKPPVWP